MLQLLKESVLSRHSERLETIVIILIGLEIGGSLSDAAEIHSLTPLLWHAVLGIITILVDLLA